MIAINYDKLAREWFTPCPWCDLEKTPEVPLFASAFGMHLNCYDQSCEEELDLSGCDDPIAFASFVDADYEEEIDLGEDQPIVSRSEIDERILKYSSRWSQTLDIYNATPIEPSDLREE